MRRALAHVLQLARRELLSLFQQPLAWIVLAATSALLGYAFSTLLALPGIGSAPLLEVQRALFTATLFWLPLLVVLPLIAMRLVAEERQTGAIELLLAAPLGAGEIAAGKLLGALVFYLALLAPFPLFLALLGTVGRLDLPAAAAGLAGLVTIGIYLLAAGLFASATTRNQVVAAAIGFVLLIALFTLPLAAGAMARSAASRAVWDQLNLVATMDELSRGLVAARRLVYPLSGAAVFVVLTAVAIDRLRGGAWRAAQVGAPLVALTLSVLANAAALRSAPIWDFTSARIYSLAPETVDALAALPAPVRVVSLLHPSAELPSDAVVELRAVAATLARAAPDRITLEEVDPLRAPLRLRELGLDPLRESANVVVVESGPRRRVLRAEDLVHYDGAVTWDGAPAVRALRAEAALTGALRAVTRARRPVVRFATGHGERDPSAPGEAGLSRWAEQLARADLALERWDALGAQEVPPGTDLVIVAGPLAPWLPSEREALIRFVAEGGAALVLLEPIPQPGGGGFAPSGLEPLLARAGLAVRDDVVLDPAQAVPAFGPESFYALANPRDPLTAPAADLPVLVRLARSLAAPGGFADVAHGPVDHAGGERHAAEDEALSKPRALVRTSPEAWGETSPGDEDRGFVRDGADPPGPLTLVAAAPSGGGRIVAAGDADLFANAAIDQLANRALARGAIGWLLPEEAPLAIPARERALARITLTRRETAWIAVAMTAGLPLLTLAVAGLVRWSRRRAYRPAGAGAG
jgi:ABC-2 type transport system permease protein